MTQTQQELERLRTLQESYHDLADGINTLVQLIREKYDIDAELAILRQRDSKPEPEEFAEYNAYCEECKTKAKEEL